MTASPDIEELMTAEEVADMLRVRAKWVYEAVRRGEIPCVKVGRRYVRFQRAAIQEWISNGGNQEQAS